MPDYPYDLVVGLETHVQLLTQTKLFCRCSTKFGAPPNTQTCPICIGMPGSLPVMNREAFKLALKTAVALNCEIPEFTKWDRKQYYYPDLPKGYQISQYDLPMSQKGWLEIHDPKGEFEPKKVGITRAHLEEDAGKSQHDEAAGKADSRIDLNRTGTPLLEIVSEPDMRSTKEARAYLTELRLLLTYLGVSDCNMQEGSLRVDANVNIHIHTPDGKIATPIVEIKNLNSFRHVERALAYEAQRQYQAWQETGKKLGDSPKQTRGWDDAKGITLAQREKEESSDYRYFPDPDLVPVITPAADVDRVRTDMIELPRAMRHRLEAEYGITAYDSDVIVSQGRPLVDYYEEVARIGGDGKKAANWVTQEVLRVLNETSTALEQFPLTAPMLGDLVKTVVSGDLDVTRGKEVFNDMVTSRRTAADSMKALGIQKVDLSELEAICKEIVAANPKVVADVKSGKQQAVSSLIGQAKKRNPNANPADVRRICLEIILGNVAEKARDPVVSRRWRVGIEGDQHTLANLEKSLNTSAFRIRRDSQNEGSFVLEANRFEVLTNAKEVRQEAVELLQLIGGAAKLTISGTTPMQATHVYEERSDGAINAWMAPQPVEIRLSGHAIVSGSGGTSGEAEGPDLISKRVSTAEKNAAVARVFRLLGQTLDWVNLYRIYEIIKKDVGGEAHFFKSKWTTLDEISRFRLTANHPDASGDEARHGVLPHDPPSSPMTVSEAKQLIFSVAQKWIDSLQ